MTAQRVPGDELAETGTEETLIGLGVIAVVLTGLGIVAVLYVRRERGRR